MTHPLGRLASRFTGRLLGDPARRGLAAIAARASRLLAAARPAVPSAATAAPRGPRRATAWGTAGLLAAFGAAPLSAMAQGPGMPGPGMPGPGMSGPGMSGPGFAGPAAPYPAETRYVGPGGTRPQPGGESPFVVRGRTGLNAGDGLGYQDGYQSFGAFVPYLWGGDSVLFADLSGFASYESNGGGGANLGLGARRYFAGINRVFGANAFFDIDGGQPDDTTFTRLGFGAESLGESVSVRVNGYVPLKNSEDVFDGFTGTPAFFVGNNIALAASTVTRLQYGGVDAEVGGPLPYLGRYGFSGFLGGYLLGSEGVDTTVGYQMRLDSHVNNDLNVGMRLTSDPDFDTNVWLTATLSTPRGSLYDFFRHGWFRQETVFEKLDSRVVRHDRAFTRVVRDDRDVLLTDPDDGNPILVTHVDPLGAAGGNGTVEAPFFSFNQFVNDPETDILRVVADTGGEATLLTNGPITLFDDQRLLSSAVSHLVFSQQGTFTLPGATPGAALPRLLNVSATPSSVIVLNEFTNQPEPPEGIHEVSGFTIDGTGGVNGLTGVTALHDGITSQGGVRGFDINRNVFEGVRSGVVLTHLDTTDGTQRFPAFDGVFLGNTLTGVGAGSVSGFDVTAVNGSDLNLLVSGNAATAFVGEDVDGDGLLGPGEDLNGDGLLTPGNGFRIAATGGAAVSATVTGNTATGNGSALTVEANTGGTVALGSAGNAFTGNLSTLGGTRLLADGGTIAAGFNADTLGENAGPQLIGSVANGGQLNLAVDGSNLDRTTVGGTGLAVVTDTDAANLVAVRVTDSSFVGRGLAAPPAPPVGPGVDVRVNGGVLDLAVGGADPLDGNTFDANAGAGLAVRLDGAAFATLDVRNNLVQNTQDDEPGVQFGTTPFNGDGIFVQLDGTSVLTDSVIDANVVGDPVAGTGNDGDGIQVTARGSSTVSDLTIGNTAPPAGDGNVLVANDFGILIRREGDATVDGLVIQDNVFRDNRLAGVSVTAAGTQSDVLDFTLQDSSITGNAGDGLNVQVEVDARVRANVRNNVIAANGGDGISLTEISGTGDFAAIEGTIADNLIRDNGERGIDAVARTFNAAATPTGTPLPVDPFSVERNEIRDNGLQGVFLRGTGGADFSDNLITGNNLDGDVSAETGLRGDGGGIDIESGEPSTGRTYSALTFTGDRVVGNFGDGVELLYNGPASTGILRGFSSAVFTDVTVLNNTNRGFDLLGRGGFLGELTVDRSVVSGNGGAGIYTVVTSDTTEGQFDAAPVPTGLSVAAFGDPTHGFGAGGAINLTQHLSLTVTDSDVVGNGNTARFNGANGLVIRVGTSGGGGSQFDTGGFAGLSGFGVNVFEQNLDGVDAGNRGGVDAVVTGNRFAGNFANDVLFESFTSTVDPPAAAFADDTGITNYFSDPKARLDLAFENNVLDIVVGPLDTADAIGAFYANADGAVKSRPGDDDPPGQFPNNTPDTRRRNAQRQDIPPGTTLVNGEGQTFSNPNFIFPLVGFGPSTFRVNDGSLFALGGDAVNFTADGTAVSNTLLFAGGIFFDGNTPGENFVAGNLAFFGFDFVTPQPTP